MARSYQVSCPPGSKIVLADMTTKQGGPRVTIFNSHASQGLIVGGDENELPGDSVGTLSTTTGYLIPAQTAQTFVIDGNESIYGRGNTATVTVTAMVFRTNAKIT